MTDERQERMFRRYGKPEQVSELAAWELLHPDDVSPAEICAFRYRDQEAADAYAASNLEHYGHPSLGTVRLEDGTVIGVLDLRPALRRARGEQG